MTAIAQEGGDRFWSSTMRRNVLKQLAAVSAAMMLPSMARAQSFPTKPIRIIVGGTPGGTSDILARALANGTQATFGQPVLVEYKPGAATNIGTDFVAKSAPDGHTLLLNGLPLAVNSALFPNLPFNVQTDLTPVIEVAEIQNVITAHPSTGLNTLKEVIEAAKAHPGRFHYGTPGAGSSGHLAAELLGFKTGARFNHVPYQGSAQATTDHIGGVLELGFINLPVAVPFIKNGRLKPLAITSTRRSPLLPEVPTAAEVLNLPDYELSGWFGIMAPAKTPIDVVARLQSTFDKALRDPAVVEIIKTSGSEVLGGSSAKFAARLKQDAERLLPALRKAGTASS